MTTCEIKRIKTFATIFSGFGGADIGLIQSGLTPIYAIEYDSEIAAVYRTNLGNHILEKDVNDVNWSSLPSPDWLHASPPCTNASLANIKFRGEKIQDIDFAHSISNAIRIQTPSIFTLENVCLYKNFESFQIIIKTLDELGYFYVFEDINFYNLGLPQDRKRLILRASKMGMFFSFPQNKKVSWHEALKDYLYDCEKSNLFEWQKKRLKEDDLEFALIPGTLNGYATHITVRKKNQPSFTITSSKNTRDIRAIANGNVYKLNIQCLAILQSFPINYVFPENDRLARKGIGNAIPPLVTRIMAELFLN